MVCVLFSLNGMVLYVCGRQFINLTRAQILVHHLNCNKIFQVWSEMNSDLFASSVYDHIQTLNQTEAGQKTFSRNMKMKAQKHIYEYID